MSYETRSLGSFDLDYGWSYGNYYEFLSEISSERNSVDGCCDSLGDDAGGFRGNVLSQKVEVKKNGKHHLLYGNWVADSGRSPGRRLLRLAHPQMWCQRVPLGRTEGRISFHQCCTFWAFRTQNHIEAWALRRRRSTRCNDGNYFYNFSP